MNLLRKTWAIIIVVIMVSCHTERLDMGSPNGNLKVTIKPAEEHASNGTSFSVTYKGKCILSQSKHRNIMF